MKDFDPLQKEQQLQRESRVWDTSVIQKANPGGIPIIDLGNYFNLQSDDELEKVAVQLHDASTKVGFFPL
jgi:hypothetical protein